MRSWRKYVIALFLLFKICQSYAQPLPPMIFENFTMKDGLSSNTTHAIAEDNRGFIWIATVDGLNRYDGYRFKQYYHNEKDSNSLLDDHIRNLLCDEDGRLWISTAKGVSCFIPWQNRFINYSSFKAPPHKLTAGGYQEINKDAEGAVWITNDNGSIHKVNKDLTLSSYRLKPPPEEKPDLWIDYLKVYTDRSGGQWAYSGLTIYKTDATTLQPVRVYKSMEQIKGRIKDFYQDISGQFWVITWEAGIYSFEPTTGKAIPDKRYPQRWFLNAADWNYKNRQIRIFSSIDGLLMSAYPFTHAKPTLIPLPAITGSTSLFADRNNNLWVTSGSEGVRKFVSERKSFEIIPLTDRGKVDFDPRSGITSLFSEINDEFWVSKNFVSTLVCDTNFNVKYKLQDYLPPTTRESIYTIPRAVFKFGDSVLLATEDALFLYNLHTKKSTAIFPNKQASYYGYISIIPLNENEVLIGTRSDGVIKFNFRRNVFVKRYLFNNKPQAWMFDLAKTRDNQIYIGAARGANLIQI